MDPASRKMPDGKISSLGISFYPREIFDSRGNPTTEVDLHSKIGIFRASCPSGASTGTRESVEIRDCDPALIGGNSVRKALKNIELIGNSLSEISDVEITDQKKIDEFVCSLDGTENKRILGANAILPVSIVFCKAAAAYRNIPVWKHISRLSGFASRMPIPYFNVLNGGAHAGSRLFAQEIMVSFEGNTIRENLNFSSVFYHALKNVIKRKYKKTDTNVGDEGGFAPNLETLEEGMELIREAARVSRIVPKVALDVAASEFYNNGVYDLGWKTEQPGKKISGSDLQNYYYKLLDNYPEIHMIEDPFSQDDFSSWEVFVCATREKGLMVVGDDLLTTRVSAIKEAGEKSRCNVLLAKMNQVGSVSETINSVRKAREYHMKVMASHRSGETEDIFLAHLSVGLGAEYIKAGALCRSERVCKYNELLRISEQLEKEL